MGDIGIAVTIGLVLRLSLLGINSTGGLLLTSLDESLFAFALRGSGSCVSRHSGVTVYSIRRPFSYVPGARASIRGLRAHHSARAH